MVVARQRVRDHLVHRRRRKPELAAERQRLRRELARRHGEKIVDDLHGDAAALRPAMDDLVAHRFKDRARALEIACRGADHEQALAALGVGRRASDGGIDETNALVGEHGAEGAARRRIDGAHVDHHHPGAAGLQEPSRAADHAGDVGGIRQHGDDDVRGRDQRGEVAGARGSSLDQHRDMSRIRIESRDVKSLADQRRRHWPAHAAEPDKADPFALRGHDRPRERASEASVRELLEGRYGVGQLASLRPVRLWSIQPSKASSS